MRIAFTKKTDRRNFFRKSIKGAILLALVTVRSSSVYSFASRHTARALRSSQRKLVIPSLWWRMLSKTSNGDLAFWDTAKLSSLKANWVSASYRPLDAQNKYVGTSWVIPPKMIEKVMELAKPGLRDAHDADIQVVGTTDSMQFNPEVMRSVGIDPELLYGRNLDGEPVGFDAYQKGNYMSCLMNPHWQAIETEVGKAHAKAGFDGIFLDLFPYAVRHGVLCGCDHCRKGWESYSQKTFGKSRNFPRGPLQLEETVDRTFYRWRIEAIHHFMQKIQNAGKEFNPDFKVILNCNADNPCMAYLLLMGMPQPTSELGQLNAGNESSLYLYRMIESVSEDQLFAQFNGSKQYLPEYKYKTALAEAYAAGGALMLAAKNDAMDEINNRFTDFLLKNRIAFEGSVSEASVGILFSWRDHTFLQGGEGVQTGRMLWKRNSARRTAAILASRGIPYDYIFVEKGLSQKDLFQYEVIIAPELKLLDDEDATAIKEFVNQGGKLLTLGAFGTMRSAGIEYIKNSPGRIKSWTSKGMENNYLETSLGKGMICAADEYIKGTDESDMITTPAFDKAAGVLNLDSQLKIKKNGNGHIGSTIRRNGRYSFIHLIRYACSGDAGETGVQLVYRIPAKHKIKTVTGISPYSGSDSKTLQWKTKGDHVTIATAAGLYTMVRVEFSE